jgi:hypothetical protein
MDRNNVDESELIQNRIFSWALQTLSWDIHKTRSKDFDSIYFDIELLCFPVIYEIEVESHSDFIMSGKACEGF